MITLFATQRFLCTALGSRESRHITAPTNLEGVQRKSILRTWSWSRQVRRGTILGMPSGPQLSGVEMLSGLLCKREYWENYIERISACASRSTSKRLSTTSSRSSFPGPVTVHTRGEGNAAIRNGCRSSPFLFDRIHLYLTELRFKRSRVGSDAWNMCMALLEAFPLDLTPWADGVTRSTISPPSRSYRA